jgi:hypothetical protein
MSGSTNAERRKEYDRNYKQTHKELYRAIRRRRRENLKDHVRKAKEKPCADCGNSYPYYVMDFDHRPGTNKSFEISDFLASVVVSTYGRVDAEIAKCDVVCSNCHRIRTHERRQVVIQ